MRMMMKFAVAFLSLAVFFSAKGYASDADDVKAAVDGYHAAIASLDLTKIAAVWTHDDTIIDKEPNAKTITVGWEGTKKNYEGLIAAIAELAITQTEGPHINVQGAVAWSTGIAKSVGTTKKGDHFASDILEADVLKKQDGRWWLVSHVSSAVPQ
jgi:ketosteroid isomerase-like protein